MNKAVLSIQQNLKRLEKDKSESYSYYLFLSKIEIFLNQEREGKATIFQTNEFYKFLDDTSDLWVDTAIDNSNPKQIKPMLSHFGEGENGSGTNKIKEANHLTGAQDLNEEVKRNASSQPRVDTYVLTTNNSGSKRESENKKE